MKSPLAIIQHYWQYDSFKPKQEEIIESVLNGRDTVALLPTGGGKSLCFQVPAIVEEGICIVISPLVALMNDQVKDLKDRGIKAIALTGGVSHADVVSLLDNATYGNYKFLYLSPERLQQEMVQLAIKRMNVNLIAIDEAHCISQWGNDFRPAYKNISILKELHPMVPSIALTATATKAVLKDTIEQLNLEAPQVFSTSFIRPNLSYQVIAENDKPHRVSQFLLDNTGSAIVYVRSRKNAEELSHHLNHLDISSTFYHGGITSEEKKKRLSDWKNEQISTMVATNAFGMGIDHGNVRFVIHVQLPESLESYFQEAGRAGRDGENAQAILLYNEDDKRLVHKQFVASLPDVKEIKTLYKKLFNYFQISYGEGEFTNHSFSFIDFCQTYSLPTTTTYNGLQTLDRLGVIQLSKEFGRKSLLKFLVPSQALLKEFENNVSFSMVGKTILRMYGGIFDSANSVRLKLVANKLGIPEAKVIKILREMEQRELVELKLHQTDASITFLLPREDDRTINTLKKEIVAIKEKKKEQVASVIGYLENDSVCKQIQLAHYFGEEQPKPCEVCSVCILKTDDNSASDISEEILILLKETPLDSRSICESLNFAEPDVLQSLQLLLDAGSIRLNVVNQYFIK